MIRRPHWSRAEENKLRSLMAGYSWPAIARIMGRSLQSCQQKASRLGLNIVRVIDQDRTSWYSVEDLCFVLGADPAWVRSRIISGVLQAENIGNEPRVSGANLRAYIRRYTADLDGHKIDTTSFLVLFDSSDTDSQT